MKYKGKKLDQFKTTWFRKQHSSVSVSIVKVVAYDNICGDWLPKRTRWSHVTCMGFPALVPQAKCSYCGHNMATKRALVFTENGWISVHKMAGAYYCTKWIRAVKVHHKEHDNDPYPLHKNAINYFLCIILTSSRLWDLDLHRQLPGALGPMG